MTGVNKSHRCELSVCLFGEGASFIGRQSYKKISFDVGYLNVIFGIEIFPDGPITRWSNYKAKQIYSMVLYSLQSFRNVLSPKKSN